MYYHEAIGFDIDFVKKTLRDFKKNKKEKKKKKHSSSVRAPCIKQMWDPLPWF
jgi:hypothetical protein